MSDQVGNEETDLARATGRQRHCKRLPPCRGAFGKAVAGQDRVSQSKTVLRIEEPKEVITKLTAVKGSSTLNRLSLPKTLVRAW